MAAHFGSNSFPTEFNFIENPIIVHVSSSGFEFPEDSTFRQVVIKVDVRSTWDGKDSTYFFYADASAGTDLSVDISSALRGAMKGWEPDASKIPVSGSGSLTYPYAIFSATLSVKYMQDGTVFEIAGASRTGAYAYYGGLSEYELMTFSQHVSGMLKNDGNNYYLSRKPRELNNGEMMETGFVRTYSYYNNGYVRTSSYVLSSENEGYQGYDGGGHFWHLPSSGERSLFLFLNSLGVLETVSAFSRESLAYGIESETKNLASAPSYFAKPNRTTHKTGGRGKLAMSSGFVTRDWADWWTTEFLMAKKFWMLYDGRWIPVTVTPADDESTVYNKAEQRIPHVDFDVEIAVEGSIRNRVRIT